MRREYQKIESESAAQQMIEEQLRLAYKLIRTNQDLQAEIDERKRVEKELLEITQKEQQRFGAELHDGVCQDLSGILMFTRAVTQKAEREGRLDVDTLKEIGSMLQRAVNQVRDTARGLYPGDLEGSSLMHSLESLAIRTQNLMQVNCQFICPSTILCEDNDVASHLYRIAQEGVNNAVRHGCAKNIELKLLQSDGTVTLTVRDDGIGFSVDPREVKGIGLKIMKYRAHMMGAQFQINPETPGVSLQCSLKFPF
ncbi:MAG: sensor histidine kinase [Deltaproteobacteria bacterium]|nr:sensor histidine kinase [Deltaproteobacteria bacterium]